MSTIPSIFNEHQIKMLVLGGSEAVPLSRMNIAAIVINKTWSQFRVQMVENLAKCGFSEIISVELSESYNLDSFAKRYPFVKFIVPLEEASDGELINLAAGEASSEYFLVLRDSLDFQHEILSPTLGSKLSEFGGFCIAPRLLEQGKIAFPILFSPEIHKGTMRLAAASTVSDGLPDLMPFDYIGLYDREKFVSLGGFDYTICQPYWQNLDLSFRAWLWGEKILLSTAFCMSYSESFPALDTTPSQYSNRFYLKNLVPRFFDDHGAIPRSSFFAFFRSSACGFFEAVRQFKEARRWVDENKYSFKRDVIDLVENWSSK